jgi:hypothetical protein
MQEAHAEMIQIFGMENPDRQWILTDYDVWEKNPFHNGPEQQHPEDDTPHEVWEENQNKKEEEQDANLETYEYLIGEDDYPF